MDASSRKFVPIAVGVIVGLASLVVPDALAASSSSTNRPATTVPAARITTGAPATGDPGGCGLAQPAFCETFDQPSSNPPSNQRAGQLNGVLWGTAMDTGSNPGDAVATTPSPCGSGSVDYPNNIQICNGQLAESVTDGGTVTSLAMYPRQPFDFAGRAGTVTFDVSNNSQGTHAAWPELWVTDQPVPDPFLFGVWQSQPRNGFGIRLTGCTDNNGNQNNCPGGFPQYVGVYSAEVVNSYVPDDSANGDAIRVIGDQAVRESGPGQMNHYQVVINSARTQIDVYGTDAFTPGQTVPPLKHLSTISNFGTLGFSRGLVWIEDAHYNGNKFNTQGTNTFRWDNVGFDGPVLPRDLGFDVPNNHEAIANIGGEGANGFNNAYDVSNTTRTLTIPDVGNIGAASGALLEYNFFTTQVDSLHVSLNGHDLSEPWPYPDQATYSPRTIAIPVPLADIVPGNNTVTFTAGNYLFQVDDIDLILQGAGGG